MSTPQVIRTGLGVVKFVDVVVLGDSTSQQITLGSFDAPGPWQTADTTVTNSDGTITLRLLVGPGHLNPVDGVYWAWVRYSQLPERLVEKRSDVTVQVKTSTGVPLETTPEWATAAALGAEATARADGDAAALAAAKAYTDAHAGGVTSFNTRTGPVSLTKSDVTSTGLNKSDVGLSNVSNTSDAAKPISTATAAALAGKADLVGGLVPTSQIPALALTTSVPVADQTAMLALTAAQVQPGDLAVRADGAGTFMLMAADPSVLANWRRLDAPTDAVTSVNGQIGTVVLAAGDVGAQPVDADLTAIAALATTPFGRALLTAAVAADLRAAAGLGTSATRDVGTAAGTVAAGDALAAKADLSGGVLADSQTRKPTVTVFNTAGAFTYNLPTWCSQIVVRCWGGGGGGAAGTRQAAGVLATGGGGGGGGGYAETTILAADLLAVYPTGQIPGVVGAGGNGGASSATDSANGGGGQVGGASYLGAAAVTFLAGGGGGAGGSVGNSTGSGAGGSAGSGTSAVGSSGSTSGATGGTGSAAATAYRSAPGGGSGGGITTADVASAGVSGTNAGGLAGTAGSFGAAGGGNAGNGSTLAEQIMQAGGSGGGGGAATAIAAGKGGNGAQPGAGGGGGGASRNGNASGGGGLGGGGLVTILALP